MLERNRTIDLRMFNINYLRNDVIIDNVYKLLKENG